MRRWFCLAILVLLSRLISLAQPEVAYFEVVDADSVRLYMEAAAMFSSGRTCFTGKDCAGGYRLTRLSSAAMFDGPFRDYFQSRSRTARDPILKAEGNYMDGKKDGVFKWYYEDGKVMFEGSYRDDRPSGYWNCYTLGGDLILRLQFDSAAVPLINYMYDTKSRLVLVKDGNGEARFVSQGEFPYSVSGRVKAGLPEGEWIGEVEQIFEGGKQSKKWIRKEIYRAGAVIEAKRYQSGRITDVCCSPELSRIYPLPAIEDILVLEEIPVEPCPGQLWIPASDPPPALRSAVPASDLNNFSSSIKSIILSKYRGRQVGEAYDVTGLNSEENRLVMHFDTNENGRPVRVKLVSEYGREFYQPIRRALETRTTWSPNQTKLVLTVFIRMTPSTYGYRFGVTLD